MAEYKSVPVKFTNKGVVQPVDADALSDGQYYDLLNSCSIHEGAISSRFGSTRKSASLGSVVHTLEPFRIGATDAEQFLYVGEGNEIYRIRMDDLSGTVVNLSAGLNAWGQRWNATKFNAGLAGKPYFFIAASRMLKDRAVTSAGAQTAAFENWGIMPPPAAPQAVAASEVAKGIYSGTKSVTWNVADSESNVFMGDTGVDTPIELLGSPVDLSLFSSTVPSGKAVDGYDSDDLIEITFTMKNQERFDQFILEFDTGSNTYLDYYRKVIIPRKSSTSTTYNTQLVVADDGSGSVRYVSNTAGIGDQPVQLPASSTNDAGSTVSVVVSIKKSDFQKIGKAGTSGYSWANVKYARVWAKSSNLGDADVTLGVTLLRMAGGSGPDNSAPGAAPYEYAYTYRNDATGHESNPSPLMVSDRYVVDVKRRAVVVSGFAAPSDTQVSSFGIYRRGGTIGNDFRLVGYVAYSATDFTDTVSDGDLQYAKSLEFDNDPPVTAKMPTALAATFTGAGSAGTAIVALTISQPSGQTAAQCLTVGTRLQVLDNEKTEYVQISAISGNNITVNFQVAHSGTIRVVTSSIVGVPCRLSTVVQTSHYLAGDQWNPHMLYKSKSGRPESFPVYVEATETTNQMPVGSPSNPIMALMEYNGECICLNRHNIFVVRVNNGKMSTPQETPAQRGLCCDGGWCKADNELFYLSDDGVYSWAGGAATKRSRQIDWFFRGQTVNGRAPIDRTATGLSFVKMAYHQNDIHLTCRDTNGYSVKWVYSAVYDRWEPHTPSAEDATYAAWTTLLSHQDKLYSARMLTSSATNAYIYEENVGSSDNGYGLPFTVQTGFYALGSASMQKQFGDIVVELTSAASLSVSVYYDFSSTAAETFTIAGGSGRRRVPLPFESGSAKEAYAVAFKFSGTASTSSQTVLHSITFSVFELAEIQRGKANDWNDWGYPHDKRLDQLIIEYDTGGGSVTLNLDTIAGISGNTQALAVSTFTLTGTGRSKATLPIKKASDSSAVVAKMIRLRPTTTAADFKMFAANITFEKYPPDVTLFTDPSDYGNPFDKYFQQLVMDIDTGGVAASVKVFLDGATTASQTLAVTTTSKTRQVNLVMTKALVGKKARLEITPGSGGKAQLFSHNFVTVPADKGPVLHSYDWDDLGTPNDKRLQAMFIEYEVTAECVIEIEGLSGITGAQSSAQIKTHTLTPSGRKKDQIQFADGTVVKMIRVHPLDSDKPPVDAKIYKYEVMKEVLPPDLTPFTPTSDLGYKCEKVFRTATLDIDTGGVDCTAVFEVDGVDRGTFTVNTSQFARETTVSFTSDIDNTVVIGRQVRWKFTPGMGGKSQLFGIDYNFTREPCPMTFFDTFEQYFGSNGYKYMKQGWIEYRSTGAIRVTVYRDGGMEFYSVDLPQHTQRDVERFYLPAVNGIALNKSYSYRITIEGVNAGTVFYLYRDSSRIETMLLSGDSRAPFNQHYLFSEMPIQK